MWCFATAEDRAWWGELWAERTQASAMADQLVADQLTTADELADVADAFRTWAAQPDAWFAVLHGEVLAAIP